MPGTSLKTVFFLFFSEKNFLKTKKHSILSALKTRCNKVLKKKSRFLPTLIFLV